MTDEEKQIADFAYSIQRREKQAVAVGAGVFVLLISVIVGMIVLMRSLLG